MIYVLTCEFSIVIKLNKKLHIISKRLDVQSVQKILPDPFNYTGFESVPNSDERESGAATGF